MNAFYAGRGQTTNQFLPPQLFGYAKKGVPDYTYNPAKAKALLQQAGLTLPVKIDFWYPTNVSRPYMPDPSRNFQAFQASLENSGFKVTPHSAPWRPDYLAAVQGGQAQVFLLGWTGDWGDPSNFLNVHFGSQTQQFGFNNPSLFALLQKADAESNLEKRTALYEQAEHRCDEVPAGRPVRALDTGAGVQEQRQGLHRQPRGPRSVLAREPRIVGRGQAIRQPAD